MAAAQHVTYRLDGPLHPSVCAKVEVMLSLSPNALAKKMHCTAAQAGALQLYLLGTLVCAYRRSQGRPDDGLSDRMAVVFRRLSAPMRLEIKGLL